MTQEDYKVLAHELGSALAFQKVASELRPEHANKLMARLSPLHVALLETLNACRTAGK